MLAHKTKNVYIGIEAISWLVAQFVRNILKIYYDGERSWPIKSYR